MEWEAPVKRTIFLIGIGPGNPDLLTQEARHAIETSQAILGAPRMLASFAHLSVPKLESVQTDAIWESILSHPEWERLAVLFSGDIGFYSGAKALRQSLEDLPGMEVVSLCGVSSFSYFCAKCGLPWEDVFPLSLHGREGNLTGTVSTKEKTFILTGGSHTAPEICRELCACGLGALSVSVGERLSYPDERIFTTTAENLVRQEVDALSVLLVENPQANRKRPVTHGLADEVFWRANVPMTKSEVRSVSLSKLCLYDGDVVYDVGAGTGSVAVEIALQIPNGTVYAIERRPEAASLIQANRDQFQLPNLQIVSGTAPQALASLPAPDRVFLGGTGGNLKKIIGALLAKNPQVRVVVNAVTLETLSETLLVFQKLSFQNIDIVQLSVSKSREVGSYHMMTGQNPVFILSGDGPGKEGTA